MCEIIHLQVHSVHSHRQSLLTIPGLVDEAAARGQRAVALTDIDGVYGMVSFVQAARAAGIKPIIGSEVTLRIDGLPNDKPSRVTLLARSAAGFRNLCRLNTGYHLGGQLGLSAEAIAEHAEGLVLLTGGQHGALPRLLALGREDTACRVLQSWKDACGADHCFVQLGPWWPASQLVQLAEGMGLGVVAAHDAYYLRPDERLGWQQLQNGHGLGHPAPGPRHLATDEEIEQTWRQLPRAIANMAVIADRCEFEPVFGVPMLPAFRSGDGMPSGSKLRDLCETGLELRYGTSDRHAEAQRRMEWELGVIEQKGFVDYFLIAWDIVRFAREQSIPYMPRGSAAGSLVLYLLGISQICPLEHHLSFERFLNPERKALPDIDLDFHWLRRDEVVDYCFRVYGEDHVARISTHQHHGPRGAVRLAGAALGIEEAVLNDVSRRMPGWTGSGDIASAIAKAPECQGLPLQQEPYRSLLDLAQSFEGIPDHLGLHPCGIVISRDPLTDVVPLEISAKGPIVTQFEMHGVEEVGLLKMDLLGNRNLAILDDAVNSINQRYGAALVAEQLPLDDPQAFALLRSGRTLGIYQMESGGVQGLLRQFQPTHVEDVTAITSLYRPGPIDGGITPRYVARRHGQESIEYPDPCLADVLGHTYGCILFQEQCLQVAHVFAGLPMGQCDNLRRGIAKRIRPEVHRIKAAFFEGAERLGRDPARTEKVWELLESFGGYGFVKSHAASCAALAVREAYVKARWPIEYLSAVLSAGMGYYPPRVYIEDARHFGATLALPCVNRSQVGYAPEEGGVLRIGLSYIHGIGPAGVKTILRGRGDRPYENLADLRRRSGLSRPEIETLISIGACEVFGVSRPGLLWQLGMLGQSKPSALPAQSTLFAFSEQLPSPPPNLGDYTPPERQQIERDLLGYTVTVVVMPQVVGAIPFAEAKTLERKAKVSIVAEVVSRFGHRTKKGEKMCFLTLSDGVEQFQAVVFPDTYRRHSMDMRRSSPIVFSGYLGDEKGESILVVTHAEPARGRRWAG